MNSRIDFIILSFILLAFIGCKDSPVSIVDEIPSEPVNETLVILNQLELDFEGFEMTYFKSIVESNGIDKIWILETEELWNTNLIVKDTINKQIRVYFKINSSGKEKFENCDNFYTDNCSTSEQNVKDTTSSVFIFDIQKNSIQVDFSPHYSTDTDSISSDENVLSEILIDFDFLKSDTTEIILEELFTTIYNPSNYSIQLNSHNGTTCKFWKFSLSKTEVSFDSQNHKTECAPDITALRTKFNTIFPFEVDEILEFDKVMGSYSDPFEIYDWDFEADEYWKIREKKFDEEQLTGKVIFEITSYSSERTYHSNPDTTFERFSKDTVIYSSKFVFDFKDKVFEFDYDDEQLHGGDFRYKTEQFKSIRSLDFTLDFDFIENQQIYYSYGKSIATYGKFEYKSGSDSLYIRKNVRFGTTHNGSDWWLEISKGSE